jgi:predicted small secreted protein
MPDLGKLGLISAADGGNLISTLNSTTTVLSAGETFQGTGEDVSKYGRAGVSVWTPFGEKTKGTLTIEVSRDGVNYGGPSRSIEDTTTAQPVMWEIVEQYFRIKYVNGAVVPTAFTIQTQYSVNGSILLGQQLGDTLSDGISGIATVGTLQGKDNNGDYNLAKVDANGAVQVTAEQLEIKDAVNALLDEQRLTNFLLKGILQ